MGKETEQEERSVDIEDKISKSTKELKDLTISEILEMKMLVDELYGRGTLNIAAGNEIGEIMSTRDCDRRS